MNGDIKGMVMSDWFGGRNPVDQMSAGNDLLMPGTAAQTKAIVDAVNSVKTGCKTAGQKFGKNPEYHSDHAFF